MVALEEVLALAVAFGQEQGPALEGCCKAALQELTRRLRPEVEQEDIGDVLAPAAAWLALSHMALGQRADGVERFSVGDLSVQRSGANAARELRQQAELLMAPHLRDTFSFRGVRG